MSSSRWNALPEFRGGRSGSISLSFTAHSVQKFHTILSLYFITARHSWTLYLPVFLSFSEFKGPSNGCDRVSKPCGDQGNSIWTFLAASRVFFFFGTPLIFLPVLWIDLVFWNVVWLVMFVKKETTREQQMGVGAWRQECWPSRESVFFIQG